MFDNDKDYITSSRCQYAYEYANKLLSQTTPVTFTYDADGNMTGGVTPEGFPFIADYEDVSLAGTGNGSVTNTNPPGIVCTGLPADDCAEDFSLNTSVTSMTMQSHDKLFTEDVNIDSGLQDLLWQGGYSADFSSVTGTTRMRGVVTIQGGTVIVDRIEIR